MLRTFLYCVLVVRDILSSPEFLSLSESEISDAIKVYISSREKRSRLNKLRFSDKEAWFNETMLPVHEDYQYSISFEGLQKHREARAERAKSAYRTRIMNQKQKYSLDEITDSSSEQLGASSLSSSFNPKISEYDLAIARVEKTLENNKLPSISDLDLILTPKRLSGRRAILLKILKDGFGLSGKCIPVPNSNKYCFSSTCNIQQLGSFIREKLVIQ